MVGTIVVRLSRVGKHHYVIMQAVNGCVHDLHYVMFLWRLRERCTHVVLFEDTASQVELDKAHQRGSAVEKHFNDYVALNVSGRTSRAVCIGDPLVLPCWSGLWSSCNFTSFRKKDFLG